MIIELNPLLTAEYADGSKLKHMHEIDVKIGDKFVSSILYCHQNGKIVMTFN